MKNIFSKIIVWALAVCCMMIPVNINAENLEGVTTGEVVDKFTDETESGTEKDFIEISSVQDLLKMKDEPLGKYILTDDIDMNGVEWEPFAFYGTLEGDGHSVLNLKIEDTGKESALTYDGNYIQYDTTVAGMFSVIAGAKINNFNLVNVRVDVEYTGSCFVGSIAGYSTNSSVTDCSVSGELSLKANAPMFGVGGVIGYGNGTLTNVTADVTLICIDTNVAEKDEQFLGGLCGAGYVNMDNCKVNIAGFVSDHGYVHNGGLIGMYLFYPKGTKYYGSITHNRITGKITFFEDNADRRAYCKAVGGEFLTYQFAYEGNWAEFTPDERFEYNRNLLPDLCDNPSYTTQIHEASEGAFGYTIYTCDGCGYSYKDNYTIYHKEEETTTQEDATTLEDEQQESGSEDNSLQNTESQEMSSEAEAGDGLSVEPYKIVLVVFLTLGVTALLIMVMIMRHRK